MNTTIRQADAEDIPRVRELYAQWVESGVTVGLVHAPPGHFEAQLGSFFVVADQDGTIVGFAIGTERTSDGTAVIAKSERYIEIHDLYVMPEHQRSGVGAQLIEEIERRAKSTGIGRFLIYSASRDIDGILRFYQNHGYNPWYIQMYK